MFGVSKIAKNDIFGLFEFPHMGFDRRSDLQNKKYKKKTKYLDHLNLLNFDFTLNRISGKIITFGQSQALTSHFEIF